MEIFGFSQQDLCNENITLDQALLLKYLTTQEGYELTLSRILVELPILNIERRQLMRMIETLCSKGYVSKSRTKHGFIFEMCQKCHLLASRCAKNVTSKNGDNMIINNNINKKIISHKIIYLTRAERALFVDSFADKYIPGDAKKLEYMDISLLVKNIKQSKFLCERPYLDYNWCIKNYDRIIKGGLKDYSKKENEHSRNYTEEELNSMFTNLDEVVI